jgi:Cu/Ag efflux pump CusA
MRALRRAVLVFLALAMCVATAAVPFQARAASLIEAQPLGLIRVAGGMSIDQAVEMVERRFNARVVRAEARDEGGRTIYVLKLLNDSGRVWFVRVDAASGSVM